MTVSVYQVMTICVMTVSVYQVMTVSVFIM